MTPTEWIAAGQLTIAAVGVSLVWRGLYQMRRAGDQREKREDARHRETMQILESQNEALRDQGQALRDQGEALRVVVAGLESVIERTKG